MLRAGDESPALSSTMSQISVPPAPSDHVRGCCVEMLTLLAVIYFLKSVLNFDVFGGPSHLAHLHKQRERGKTVEEEAGK